MNDWYVNKVSFSGNEQNVMEVLAFFKEIIYENSDELSAYGDFQDFSFLNNGDVTFRSKGDSGLDVLREIAEHFHVDFMLRFAAQHSFGKAMFAEDRMRIIVLNDDELRLPGYNDEQKAYTIGNLSFSTQPEALGHILEQKWSGQVEEKGFDQVKKPFKR